MFSGIGEFKNITFSWERMLSLQCQWDVSEHNFLLAVIDNAEGTRKLLRVITY